MNALGRFELFMESLVERGFSRLLRTRLQPVEVAKRLSREMEAQRTVAINKVLVPNRYEVSLNPRDYDQFAPIQAMLQKEIATYLMDYAGEHNYTIPGEAGVVFERDDSVRTGGIKVTTRLEDPGEETYNSHAPLQPTRVMPLPDLPTSLPSTSAKLPIRARVELQGSTCYLDQDVANLGRGLDNDVVVEDARVSRHHARLQRGPHGWEIVDLASTNGTFVNGKQVRQRQIASGDTLSLGGLEMKFYLDVPKR